MPAKVKRHYDGWTITDQGPDYHPITGRFRAARHGVGMGHSTEEGLIGMIDARRAEEEARRHIQPAVLAAYVDAGLRLAERAQVDRHLAECPRCVQELANTARTMRELTEALPVERIDVQAAAERLFRQAILGLIAVGILGIGVAVMVWVFSEWQLRHG